MNKIICRFLWLCLISVFLVSCSSETDDSNMIGNRCTIILHPNNGNADITYYGVQGDFLTLPTPFKLNHSFSYWFDSDLNIFNAGNQFAYSSNKVLELWGRWNVKIDLPESYEDIYGQSELPVEIPEISGDDYCSFWINDKERIYPGTITCPFDNFKLDLMEHVFDSGVITKPNSHTENGVKTYTCTFCGETRTEVIPADSEAHTWNDGVIVYPTQTEPGAIVYTCMSCGAIIEEELDFSEEWTSDDDNHWHIAITGQDLKSDFSNHSFTEIKLIKREEQSTYVI